MQIKALFSTIFLGLAFTAVQAQDCKLKSSTDAFTHEKKLSTGFVVMSLGGVPAKVSVDATPTEIDIFFWFTGDGNCFDDNSSAVVMYAGERSRYTVKNGGSMNCEGAFHIKYKNQTTTPSQLQKMTVKKLENVKITGNNKTELTLTFTPEQQDQIMKMIGCVVTEGKSLLKK